MDDSKTYDAQVLVIVMIILILGVVIALALYSRTVKNRQRVSSEKRSSEAIQEVDAIIGAMKVVSREKLLTVLEGRFASGETSGVCWDDDCGCCVGGTDFSGFITSLDIDPGVLARADLNPEMCFKKEKEIVDGYSMVEGNTYSFPMRDVGAGCKYTFDFEGGDGVVVHKVYASLDADGNVADIKPYAESDILGFCRSGGICSTDPNFVNWTTGNDWQFTPGSVGGYNSYEVRLIPIGGSVIVKISASNGCGKALFLRVTASSTSSGNYQGSYYRIPTGNVTPSFFDYVLYNREGGLHYSGN